VREAAAKALKLDARDADAHVFLGEVKRILDWDVSTAAKEFQRAVELEPKATPPHFYSAVLAAQRGERDEALAHLERAAAIDPASLWVNSIACELYRCFGLYEEAIAAGERAMQLDPEFLYREPTLGAAYRETKRFDEAIALYKKTERLIGKAGTGLAVTYAAMGRTTDAQQIVNGLLRAPGYKPADAMAAAYVALGQRDEAFECLERAASEHSATLHNIGILPEFVPLRGDPRFATILKRIGLEPEKVFASTAPT
jgi:tetratricopeptide (TPR) repeat protein